MNKDKIVNKVLKSKAKNLLLEFSTGTGKSKVALDFINKHYKKGNKILIVIPKLVLIENWKEEFRKWGYEQMLEDTVFTTYVSLGKHTGEWSYFLADEAHHLSERCLDIIPEIKSDYNILLSATVGYKKKWELKAAFPNLEIYQLGLRKAIEDEILPDPKVYLIPLSLDNKVYNKQIVKNPKCKDTITINYADRYNYRNVKNKQIIINCTQQQFYNDISGLINYYKLKANGSKSFMDMYLRECGKRLKWLSNEKTNFVKFLLDRFKDRRVLTFCNSIEQTETLCKFCINSKNKDSMKYLELFNNKEINHITAAEVLTEGVNLSDCEIGIFAVLNSSQRLILQKLGRYLRHKNPIIIIPYYINTREEEIVTKMLENYNQDLVTKITDIKELSKI